MTPAELIAAFEVLAEAPDGVARLRDSIMELAVRGRLVQQDPTDEPASAMLGRVVVKLARLGKRKPVADSAPIVPLAGVPFAVPGGWVWCRLGSILVECRNGTSASPNDGQVGYPVLRISACTSRQDAVVDLEDCKFVEMPEDSALPFFVEPGDLLACRYNGNLHYVGRVALVPTGNARPTLYPDKLMRLRALEVQHRYLRIAINAGPTRRQIAAVAATTAGNIGINGKQLQALLVPLPPLAEQHRIVARVEELMGLLDRLEAAREKRETTRAAARDSVLDALREADSPAEVDAAWTRFAERMDDLVYEPADIAPLRQTVLQLAVRGRLVPQDPRDQVASAFLGKREIAQAQKPFTLPSGWAWSCLGMLGRVVGGGTPSKSNSRYWDGAIPWVTPKDMKQDRIADSIDHITDSAIDGSAAKLIPPTALLMVVRGMILAHSFPTALTDVDVTINQDMKALVPFDGKLAPWLLILTKGSRDRVLDLVARSSHGTCKLKTDELLRLPLPIPPWTEQRRIVARVEEIMGLLDRLQARLTAGKTVHEAFAASAVHNLEPEELPMASTAQGAGRWHSG